MSFNKMNRLLNKIERRLGTKPLMLPDDIKKDTWVEEAIEPDTILTFSRYFPHKVRIIIDTEDKNNLSPDGYFVINTDMLGGAEIMGVKDIAWDIYNQVDGGAAMANSLGLYDYIASYNRYSLDDVMLLQARADMVSVFNNSIFIDFQQPNKIKLQSVTGGSIKGNIGRMPIDLYVTHPTNLSTIPPTQMEVFENLATSDVANMLVAYLSHYEGLETVFASVDLKLSYIERWADRREEFVQQLKDGYVSPANENQPILYTV